MRGQEAQLQISRRNITWRSGLNGLSQHNARRKRAEKRAAESGAPFAPIPITYSRWGGLYQLDRGNGRQWIVPLHVFEGVKFFANAYKVEVIRKRRSVEPIDPHCSTKSVYDPSGQVLGCKSLGFCNSSDNIILHFSLRFDEWRRIAGCKQGSGRAGSKPDAV